MKCRFRHTLLLFLLVTVRAEGQEFFISAGDSILRVNPTLNGCTYRSLIACAGQTFYSITFFKDTLYYIEGEKLYKAVVTNDILRDCFVLATLPVKDATSLTVDNSGVLYFAYASEFYKIDPRTGIITFLGIMPYASAGDMVFYKDELYMASLNGIVKVNISDPPSSTLFIPSEDRSMFGLAVLSVDCNKNQVFVFSVQSFGTLMTEVDVENQRFGSTVCTLPFQVFDAASNVENGDFVQLEVTHVDIKPSCELAARGSIEVNLTPRLTQFYYSINGSAPSTNNVFPDLEPGDHQIQITTAGGCLLDTTIRLPSFGDQRPLLDFSKKDPTCISAGSVTFQSTSNPSKFWIEFNGIKYAINHTFTPLKKGSYQFDIWNQYNCKVDSFTAVLNIDENCDVVYFPDAFTPNNDGKNDVFRPSYNYAITDFDWRIFNRWGQKVFASDDMTKAWDGTVGGIPQATGTFVWVVSYKLASGERVSRKGTVVLIR